MRHSWTVDFRSSAVSQAATLSRAIRDGNFHTLPDLSVETSTTTSTSTSCTGQDNNIDDDESDGRRQSSSSRSLSSSSSSPSSSTRDNVWWEANSRGWTAVHVAAASSASMSVYWWKWILQRAAAAAAAGAASSSSRDCLTDVPTESERRDRLWTISPLWEAKTDLGQTCIDLFFRTALCPLPWQRHSLKERARRTRWAMETICACPVKIGDLRKRLGRYEIGLCENQDPCHGPHNNESARTTVVQDENDPVSLVLEFWQKLQLILYYASGRHEENDIGGTTNMESKISRTGAGTISVIHLLSSLSWCPEIVGRLVLQLYPGHAQYFSPVDGGDSYIGDSSLQVPSTIASGSLPLHIWSRTQSWRHCHGGSGRVGTTSSSAVTPASTDDENDTTDQTDPGILRLLCKAYPTGACIPDPNNHNRLPLHAALVLGKPWDDTTRIIFDAYPEAVMEYDPQTNLPCFCLPALEGVTVDEQEEMAKQQNRRLSLCWSYISSRDKTIALEQASALIDRQRLTTIYHVLQQHPLAVQQLAVADNTS